MWNEFVKVAAANQIIPLSTIADGFPIVRPMVLTALGEKFYIHTKSDSKKVHFFEQNPAFSSYLTDKKGFNYFFFGKVSEVKSLEEKKKVFNTDSYIQLYFTSAEDPNLKIYNLNISKLEWYNENGGLEQVKVS